MHGEISSMFLDMAGLWQGLRLICDRWHVGVGDFRYQGSDGALPQYWALDRFSRLGADSALKDPRVYACVGDTARLVTFTDQHRLHPPIDSLVGVGLATLTAFVPAPGREVSVRGANPGTYLGYRLSGDGLRFYKGVGGRLVSVALIGGHTLWFYQPTQLPATALELGVVVEDLARYERQPTASYQTLVVPEFKLRRWANLDWLTGTYFGVDGEHLLDQARQWLQFDFTGLTRGNECGLPSLEGELHFSEPFVGFVTVEGQEVDRQIPLFAFVAGTDCWEPNFARH